jgi:large subunit ribosomal protein L13
MSKLIVDGKDAIFGRLASTVAKDLLKGHSVDIINCELIIVSGDKKLFAKKVLTKGEMGRGASMKGPKYPRVADKLVKRMMRGMIPRTKAKGREAFKRLKCYEGNGPSAPIGVPSGEGKEDIKEVKKFEHQKPMKYSTIKEIVEILK